MALPPKTLAEIDLSSLTQGRNYYPSPTTWEDEILYFLLLDRFSDGKEYNGFLDNNDQPIAQGDRTTDLFSLADANNINRDQWFTNGQQWCGGNLRGLTDKLGYLKRLGITAVWISPVFKQTAGSNSYHGYGIQNFLDTDPHFGTPEELKTLVDTAHQMGIRVILDIILNHAGNVFAYEGGHAFQYNNGQTWNVNGYKTKETDHIGSLPFEPVNLNQHPEAWPDGAVWPQELQPTETWTKKGEIKSDQWDSYPAFTEGDFYSLKDISHGTGDTSIARWDILKQISAFSRSKALEHLATAFKYWIAYADIDGYRIDTVKHMEPGAVRYFTNVIHEYAQSLGKENFYLIGEITGGRSNAVSLVDTTGLNAALGIDDVQDKLEFLAKGWRTPFYEDDTQGTGYFNLFNNSLVDGKSSHQWFGKRIVTMFDDHDQVGTDHKFRFCGQGGANVYKKLPLAIALNVTTLGIPCLYYGTEQAFNGADHRINENKPGFGETFLRECMFGGGFGSLQSTGKHFFNEQHEVYTFISKLCALRKQLIPLRRGRQYIRQIASPETPANFYYPALIGGELNWVIAWSRIFNGHELLCAINTHTSQAVTVWITVDFTESHPGTQLKNIFPVTDNQPPNTAEVINIHGRAAVQITVPAGGFVMYSNQ